MHLHQWCWTGALLLVPFTAATSWGEEPAKTPQPATAAPTEQAVKQARKTVQLLDNIYKQTIVLVTEKYVLDEEDYPAGSAAVELFRRLSTSDAQHVRLIDVTGEPYEPANVAVSDFEIEGVKQLKAGKTYYDQVIEKDGKQYLRAITPVPVVMKRCIMCHSHYADAKPGEPIGAISYELPLD